MPITFVTTLYCIGKRTAIRSYEVRDSGGAVIKKNRKVITLLVIKLLATIFEATENQTL